MDSIAKINQAAPEITLLDLEGRPCGLDRANADLLLLNFWSAECPWSERADRILADLKMSWKDKIEVWSIDSNANEQVEQIVETARRRGLGQVYIDPDHEAADVYGALTTPHFFLLDKDRILRYMGALDDTTFRQREPTENYLSKAVQALLVGRNPDPQVTDGYGCTIVRFDLKAS